MSSKNKMSGFNIKYVESVAKFLWAASITMGIAALARMGGYGGLSITTDKLIMGSALLCLFAMGSVLLSKVSTLDARDGLVFAAGACVVLVCLVVRYGHIGQAETVERIDPSNPMHQRVAWETIDAHIERYQFAKRYCVAHNIRSAADIASGTCYGTNILSEAVPVVHGYDRDNLCGNRIIDLEKESWSDKYDVIVSFETIEHLANPEFFLQNAVASAPRLILSTPVSEPSGNPFHKQHWSVGEVRQLLSKYYRCEYWYQSRVEISRDAVPRFIIAACERN